MQHAFPEDELRPISCGPLTRDRDNPSHIEVNDVLGNYSLTLIDSLSTLAIIASSPATPRAHHALADFQNGVKDFVFYFGDGSDGEAGEGARSRGFDLDSKVQVFETAIRGLGGLLSAHLFAIGELPISGYEPIVEETVTSKGWFGGSRRAGKAGILWPNGIAYNGQLLRLAHDLGARLIPAFYTTTGIPYPRVNLRDGIPFYLNSPLHAVAEEGQCEAHQQPNTEVTETCSAGAGSLILEFTVLSRLTGDERFEDLAKRAFWAIWSRKSEIGLIGSGIDAETGNWIGPFTGIGAGIDSFFEYAFKTHVLLSNKNRGNAVHLSHKMDPRLLFDPLSVADHDSDSFLEVWKSAHAAIQRHLYRGTGHQHPHYVQGDLFTGATRAFWIDSLSAYYPGLLTLAGELDEAIETHLLTTAIWTRFSALPERWSLATGGVEGGLGWWPGRPEFIESTWYLYRATKDPWYLHVGEMVLRDIMRRCWTNCGWAGLQDVRTGELTDRMESFFLGETAKYLFLLFEPDHPLNHLDQPFVFTTEGHPLLIPSSIHRQCRKTTKKEERATSPGLCVKAPKSLPLSVSSTAARGDVFRAAALARLHLMSSRDNHDTMLAEFTVDHPSLTLADAGSPTNYTYFPWTLPRQLIPQNGISLPMTARPTFDISFPPLPAAHQSSLPLQRVKQGLLLNSVGGVRLGMIQDVSFIAEDGVSDQYRIQSINNLALGKDEKVFLAKDTTNGILNPADPNFTRIRDGIMLDLVIDAASASHTPQTQTANNSELIVNGINDMSVEPGVKATLTSMLSQMSALIREQSRPFSFAPAAEDTGRTSRFYVPAVTPTGQGAVMVPDWAEAQSPTIHGFPNHPLQFSRIYSTDELCNGRLPLKVPRTHQVIVIKRGGCSFSQKLRNIPAFAPAASSLHLVIIVSYSDEAGAQEQHLIRPLMDEQQFTTSGLLRHNPIPMVLVAGGERTYQALQYAKGIGIKRRYKFHAQGVPISNLIII